jgi:hypothetical protein
MEIRRKIYGRIKKWKEENFQKKLIESLTLPCYN